MPVDDEANCCTVERDESEEYRPVSGLAVTAAVVGCLSAITIFSPIFWFIPLLGTIVSLIALRDLAQPGLVKIGRVAALAGLALSIGFGCQAMTLKLVARQMTAARVSQAALVWLAAVREDRLMDARGMMSPSILPAPEYLGAHEDAPAVNDPITQEAAFRKLSFIKTIGRCGKADASARCTGSKPDSQESKETWTVRIRLSPCDDESGLEVQVELQPTLQAVPGGRLERWEITQVEIIETMDPRQ